MSTYLSKMWYKMSKTKYILTTSIRNILWQVTISNFGDFEFLLIVKGENKVNFGKKITTLHV